MALSAAAGSELSTAAQLDLVVDAQDLSGQRLDANPATVATWSDGAWSGYEDADGRESDQGGASAAFRLVGAGLAEPAPSGGAVSSGGGSGGLGLGALLGLGLFALALRIQRRRRFFSARRSGSRSARSA